MINHPTLGELMPHENLDGVYSGRFPFNNRILETKVDQDGVSLEVTLEKASDILKSLEIHHSFARQCLVRDMLKMYNEGWREYDEAQEDGSTITIENPKLGESEFVDNFLLETISIYGSGMVELWFKDEGIFFGGHSVFVCWTDISDQNTAQAEMYG